MFWFLALLLVFLLHDVTSFESSNLQETPLVIRFSFGMYNNNIGKRLELLLRRNERHKPARATGKRPPREGSNGKGSENLP